MGSHLNNNVPKGRSVISLVQQVVYIMVVRVVEFSSGGYKIKKDFLSKNEHTHRKLMNFENWCSAELSKIGIILLIKSFKNLFHQKKSISKNVLLNWYFQ